MFTTEPGPDRDKLGFREEVLSNFNFLITDYSFQCMKTEVTFVRFESKKLFVNVYHGRTSYEFGFEIGKLDMPEREHSLSELMELEGVIANPGDGYFQTSTKEGVQKCLPKLADLVKQYAKRLLAGDMSILEKLAIVQQKRYDNYLKEMELSRILPEAEEAWREKRYKEYIELLEPIEKELSLSKLKKLEYARKHLDKV